MRRGLSHTSGNGHTSRKKCVQCKLHRDVVGDLSRRGLCDECAVANRVAQMLGLTHMFVTTEDINGRVLSVYAGQVSKVA